MDLLRHSESESSYETGESGGNERPLLRAPRLLHVRRRPPDISSLTETLSGLGVRAERGGVGNGGMAQVPKVTVTGSARNGLRTGFQSRDQTLTWTGMETAHDPSPREGYNAPNTSFNCLSRQCLMVTLVSSIAGNVALLCLLYCSHYSWWT